MGATLRDCSQKKTKVRVNMARPSHSVAVSTNREECVFAIFGRDKRGWGVVVKKGKLTVRKEEGTLCLYPSNMTHTCFDACFSVCLWHRCGGRSG